MSRFDQMTELGPVQMGPAEVERAIEELIALLREEIAFSNTLAEALSEAVGEKERYLHAIAERDVLIEEYVESVQNLRRQVREGTDHP